MEREGEREKVLSGKEEEKKKNMKRKRNMGHSKNKNLGIYNSEKKNKLKTG